MLAKKLQMIGQKTAGAHTEILLMLSSRSSARAVHANAPRSAADSEGNRMMKLYYDGVSSLLSSLVQCQLELARYGRKPLWDAATKS
jgi:hypothetical protein